MRSFTGNVNSFLEICIGKHGEKYTSTRKIPLSGL